jgi:hypothetical protein
MPLISKEYLAQQSTNLFENKTEYFSSKVLLNESKKTTKQYDVFLSHSFLDAIEIRTLKAIIEKEGLTVYVDWIEDSGLNRGEVTKKTAQIIRERMKNCKSLFYAFSENSNKSKWMPWELGFFDGFNGSVVVIPIKRDTESSEDYNGIEFVGIYPYITITNNKKGIPTSYINETSNIYVTFSEWKKGKRPYER